MGERTVRPFNGMQSQWPLLLVVLAGPLVMVTAMGVVVFPSLGMRFLLTLLLTIAVIDAVMLGLMYLVHLAIARKEWIFNDSGFATNKRSLSLWTSVWSVRYDVIGVGNSGAKPSIVIQIDPLASPMPVILPLASLVPNSARVILAELIAHVRPEGVDPRLLVIADMLDTADKLKSTATSKRSKLYRRLESFELKRALPSLEPARALPVGDLARPWLLLLLAESYLLLDRAQDAADLSAELERAKPGWPRALLVKGLADARLGNTDSAAETLRAVEVVGAEAQVLESAAETVKSSRELPKGSTVRRTLMVVFVSIGIVLYPFARVFSDLGDIWSWARTVGNALTVALVVAFLITLGLEIAATSKSERERQESADAAGADMPGHPQTPPAMGIPTGYPPDQSSRNARAMVYIAIAVLVLFSVAFIAIRAVGVIAPSLLGSAGGEWFAGRQFFSLAIPAVFVCFLALLHGVRTGALAGSRKARNAVPSAYPGAPGTSSESRPALNANISTGWAVAAIGTAVACAGIALGLAAWEVPTPQCLTTDAQGRIHAVLGDKVMRWDDSGRQTQVADLQTAPQTPTDLCDLRVGPDGSLYLADMSTVSVLVFGPDGKYLKSLRGGERFMSTSGGGWDISAAPGGQDTLVLDGGRLVAADNAKSSVRAVELKDLAPALASATEAIAQGKASSLTGKVQVAADLRAESPVLRWAQSIDRASDGSIYVADTQNGRVLRSLAGKVQSIDCLGLPDGYRYPSVVRVAPDGAVYAVMRKKWEDSGKDAVGAPLSGGRYPDIWMGRLYRFDFTSRSATLVDARHQGAPISVDFVGFLPDGTLAITALNEAWVYRVPNQVGVVNAERMAAGELGDESRKADLYWRASDLGPQLFWALAVVLPIGLGFAGVTADRRRRQADWTPAMPVVR